MAQYLKPDSALGYVEDLAEIQKAKINNLRHSVLGCMLGDFDETGAYVVSQEIKEELIAMEKFIVESFDNIELCKGVLKLDKQISFMVTFEGNRATLALVEKLNYEANMFLNSGTYSNINEYILDVVETSGEVNRNVIYDRWNIKAVQGAVLDIFNCDEEVLAKYFGITKRFKYLLVANKTLLQKEEELEEIEAEYATTMFEILSHYPNLEKAVLDNLKQTLKEKKNALSVKKPFFAKTLNEILENSIQQNLSQLSEEEKQNFLQEQRNAILASNVKLEDALSMDHVKQEGEETSPDKVMLQIPNSEYARPIADLAEEFVGENKQVEGRLNGENTNLFQRTLERNGKTLTNDANRGKLSETLSRVGLADYVGIPREVKKDETVTATHSTPAPTPTPAKKVSATNASAGSTRDSGKGKGGGKSGGGSPAKKGKTAAEAPQDAKGSEQQGRYNPDTYIPSVARPPVKRISKDEGVTQEMANEVTDRVFAELLEQKRAERAAGRTGQAIAQGNETADTFDAASSINP